MANPTTRIRRPWLAPMAAAVVLSAFSLGAPTGHAAAARALFQNDARALDGSPALNASAAIQFAPATVTAASFLGGEPQVNLARPLANSVAGAVDPNLVLVDSIFGFGNGTSTLSRSLDGGDTFRPLLDLTCSQRNRPTCAQHGGGDANTRINLYDGSIFFADQAAVAQETVASSLDKGDTWPAARQHEVGNASAGDDRQWLSAVNAPGHLVTLPGTTTPVELRAMFSYHIPAAGEYIQGIDTNGVLLPQPVTQIAGVGQSSFSRVDTTGGPGDGYMYQPYWDTTSSAIKVGVSPLASYYNPSSWAIHQIDADNPAIFVGFNLDTAGNAYAAWIPNGIVSSAHATGGIYYRYSLISDPANNPTLGGSPGSKWSDPIQINDPGIGSTAFVEVVAGDPGNVAVAYLGTTDYSGLSDNAPNNARWNEYMAFMQNGLTSSPTVTTALVSHRVLHTGSVCTSGTTCLGDRSLVDLHDVGIDKDGRVGVVFEDNNNQMARDHGSTATNGQTIMGNAFTHFAKETVGPSLFNGKGPFNIAIPSDTRVDPEVTADATWPNTAAGTNLPGLQVINTTVNVDDTTHQIVGRINLADASQSARDSALTAFNGVVSSQPPAARLQYVLRFTDGSVPGDVHFLSMDYTPGSGTRFFGEKLDGDDAMISGAGTGGPAYRGAAYHADAAFHVTGSITGNTIEIRGSQTEFGLADGANLYSVTALAMAGPAEGNEVSVADLMRTVDVSAPFDTTLVTSAPIPEAPAVAALLATGGAALALVAFIRRRRRLPAARP